MPHKPIKYLLLILLSACLSKEPPIEAADVLGCEDGSDCPAGYFCDWGACVNLSTCGDGVVQSWEVCDDGDANSDDWSLEPHCNASCSGNAPHCGDGDITDSETCDAGDANTATYSATPGCNTTCPCPIPHCGNGDVQSSQGEVCDSGDDNSDSYSIEPGCNLACSGSNPHCGDNTINGDEVCDDGEANSDSYSFAEHCNGSCTANYSGGYCGDSNINAPFETCDDGNDATRDSCPSGPNGPCQPATCGDGLIWDTDGGVEQCEPGVTEALSCQEIDNAELEGVASCSDILCRYNTTACFDGPPGFVGIEAGTFTMGSPESELGRQSDETQHEVILTNDFYLSDHEVTQAEWGALIGINPSGRNNGTCPTCPVEKVNWWEALYYANSLSNLEGLSPCYVLEDCSGAAGEGLNCTGVTLQDDSGNAVATPYECEGYRLPTEAEWEYAARAGTTTAFYNGDITVPEGSDPNANDIAWYGRNSDYTTYPVRGKLPNAWGLYDVSGNVGEWTWDWLDFYSGDAADPAGPSSGSSRVLRGGSWNFNARYVRVAYRNFATPGYRSDYIGFRLARTAP